MIVPIIFSLNSVADEKMFTWVFIKAVSFAKKYHWSVIAQKQYFDENGENKAMLKGGKEWHR